MGRLIRHILEAYTRESLGYAAITSGRWWPYRKRLVAYEVPDGSLLFSVRPGGWFRSALVVAEADAKTVALIQGECLLGPSRQILARRRATDRQAGAFVNPVGAELVRWESDNGGTTVSFTDFVRSQPLLKMGLLAAILVND
jgi:hypothetical protein